MNHSVELDEASLDQVNVVPDGSGLIQYGSGSSIFAQSGSGSKLKQNFRTQFFSQIFLKSKFEPNQIKSTGVFINFFFQKVPVGSWCYFIPF
jgi:hypothetical protein